MPETVCRNGVIEEGNAEEQLSRIVVSSLSNNNETVVEIIKFEGPHSEL